MNEWIVILNYFWKNEMTNASCNMPVVDDALANIRHDNMKHIKAFRYVEKLSENWRELTNARINITYEYDKAESGNSMRNITNKKYKNKNYLVLQKEKWRLTYWKCNIRTGLKKDEGEKSTMCMLKVTNKNLQLKFTELKLCLGALQDAENWKVLKKHYHKH